MSQTGYTPHGSWDVAVLYPQMTPEIPTALGTVIANAPFSYPGPITEMSDSLETGSLKRRQIGNRDIHSLVKTGEMYAVEMTWNPIDDALMNYCINLPGVGAENISIPLQLVVKQTLDGVVNWIKYEGCVCESFECEIQSNGAAEASATFLVQNITAPAITHGLPGTPTFVTVDPGTPIWTNFSPGSGPLRWNSAVFDTDVFGFSVSNNPKIVKPCGETKAKFIKPTLRDIEFEFDGYYSSSTVLFSDVKALTPRALEFRLSADRRVQIGNAYANTWETSRDTGGDFQKHEISGVGTTCAITTY